MIKKILITGENSYVGNQLANWLNKITGSYEIIKVSVRDNKWRKLDFSSFDVVVHVAGIAHQDTKKDQEDLYYRINRDLTIELANKAKNEGVKQFIFMSSMIVYGTSSKIDEIKLITKDTVPSPINYYGNSKLLAEEGILPLQSKDFRIVILRPPMIYGEGSKGNYPILSKFAKLSPIFPEIQNQRSMIYIDNLTEFIHLMILNKEQGTFFPQNNRYVNTTNMVELIAKVNGKNITTTHFFNFIIKLLSKKFNILDKIFGDLCFNIEESNYKTNYNLISFEESIKKTEKYNCKIGEKF